MKKYGSLVALVVVAVLAVVFFATRDKPAATVVAPYSIAKVDNLSRIELTRPGDQLVVMEKIDGAWHLTKPVDSPLAENAAREIDEALAAKINTDDLPLSADKRDALELDDANAVKVALFTQGASAPSAEFFVGKAVEIPGTRAERTFIKASDGNIYRAQTDLGDVLRRDVETLRSRQVQKFERDAIEEVTIVYRDGATLQLTKGDGSWVLTKPAVEIKLENSRVSALVSNFANLVASGFVNDKKPADVGLEPPYAEVIAKVDGKVNRLLVSPEVEGEKKFYVKTPDSEHIYEISQTNGNALTPTVDSLRNRLVLDVKPDAITRMEFGGADRAVVEKKDGTWQLVRPTKGLANENALSSRLTSFGQLRAIRFEQKDLREAGLDKPTTKLTFTTNGKPHTLLVGGEADAKGNLYAKWQDSELVMVVPQWVKDRANTQASDLSVDES